jgi:hypothetical protein
VPREREAVVAAHHTNIPEHEPESARFPFSSVYDVTARSLLLFTLEAEA